MTSELIGSALDRVVNSKTFSRSRSLQDFLTFIVTQSLEPDQNLKEYRIGVDVLHRGGAFDPAANSIVRVQAHRLRAKLADYYQHEGQTEDLRIDLSPGSYTPVIREGAVATLRSLRFGNLIIDILPANMEPDVVTSNKLEVLLYAFVASNLELLLHSGLPGRTAARAPRTHLQFELRARVTTSGVRALTYITDATSKWVLWSHGDLRTGSVTSGQMEQLGAEIAQAAWERIHVLLSCNG